jgi:8-oxo-dGTP diphosphatase
MNSAPRALAVGAVIVGEDGRVLLVQRDRPPRVGTWSLPGGRVEDAETVEAAVVREVLEETGLTVRVRAPLGVVRLSREGYHYDIHEFLCSIEGPADASAGDDARDVSWAAPKDLLRLGVSQEVLKVIRRGLEVRRRQPPGLR